MRNADFYRYFVGCRPDPATRDVLADTAARAGQRVHPKLLHLTLCVIAELTERASSLLPHVSAALGERALSTFRVALGRVRGGPHGAFVGTLGQQDDIQDCYSALGRLLRLRGITPLHRRSGLHPHVTLGHDPCQFESYKIGLEWFPKELLLIESEVGRTRHNVIGRWPLLPPRQGSLPFNEPMGPLLLPRLTAG